MSIWTMLVYDPENDLLRLKGQTSNFKPECQLPCSHYQKVLEMLELAFMFDFENLGQGQVLKYAP